MSHVISTKAEGVELYSSGFFGNHLRQWKDLEDLLSEPRKPDTLVIRECGVAGGGVSKAGVPYKEVFVESLKLWQMKPSANLYYGEALKDQPKYILLQGEYLNGSDGEHLTYTTVKDYFRPAMEKGATTYRGPGCRLFLKQAMDSRSYENFENLAECYPDHVIEFTVMDGPCGNLKLNTIIWEVRKY